MSNILIVPCLHMMRTKFLVNRKVGRLSEVYNLDYLLRYNEPMETWIALAVEGLSIVKT